MGLVSGTILTARMQLHPLVVDDADQMVDGEVVWRLPAPSGVS